MMKSLMGTNRKCPSPVRAPHPAVNEEIENLQPINSFKLRGAVNAVAMLSDSDRKRGV
jgi:hypothetical protein